MILDDTPILARKAKEHQHYANIANICEAAGKFVLPQFKPFEKYCGKPRWVVDNTYGGQTVQLMVLFDYKNSCGHLLELPAKFYFPRSGKAEVTGFDKAILLDELSPKALADAYVGVITCAAETAFEAVVLDEPWRLGRIFRYF